MRLSQAFHLTSLKLVGSKIRRDWLNISDSQTKTIDV